MNRGVLMWMGVIAVAGASAFACDVVERPALRAPAQRAVAKALPSGTYNVQSVQYDDGTGDYRVFLLDAPAGSRPVFESDDVKMARLDDAALAAGGKSTLTMDGEAATLNLTPDFQIAYVHNVTEESVDPVTGARGVTVVRQEQSFWTPFAAAMAGNRMSASPSRVT